MAVQPDGKVVATGYDTEFPGLTVRRFRTDGTPDPGFGVNGVTTVPATYQDARGLTLQPDGAILVAGGALSGVDADVVIVRLSPTGAIDPSFGSVKGARVDAGGNEVPIALTVLPTGQVAATGLTTVGSQPFAVVLGADGTPDPAFGPKGLALFGGFVTPLLGLTAQPDGKLLAVTSDGATVARSLVVRLQGSASTTATPQPAAPTCHGKAATIVGTDGKDRLKGTRKADVIVALGGNDVVKGLGGNDVVCAGDGADRVSGGAGKDLLYGEKGKDRLVGGSGNDRLVGGPDRDTTHQ